jgi:phage-related protein
MGQSKWTIEFYVKSNNNRCPVDEFLADLSKQSKRDLVFIRKAMDRLSEHGNELGRPHAAYLRDDIYELRPKHYRLFYFFFDGTKIIITHGYAKKTNAVDPNQIDKAIEYRKDYYSSHEE